MTVERRRPPRGLVGGVFVGGASRRMGRDKGLLEAPGGGTLVARAASLLARVADEVVLVGDREAYRGLPWPCLPDDPPGIGPLGGLSALLAHAGERRSLVLACDMPYVDASDLRALLAAPRSAAPRRDGRWEPLCARYDPEARAVVTAQIQASSHDPRALRLQRLLDRLEPEEVPLPAAHLRDWDRPEDVP